MLEVLKMLEAWKQVQCMDGLSSALLFRGGGGGSRWAVRR